MSPQRLDGTTVLIVSSVNDEQIVRHRLPPGFYLYVLAVRALQNLTRDGMWRFLKVPKPLKDLPDRSTSTWLKSVT